MRVLPKYVVILCFNICSSLYIGIGVYGLLLDTSPRTLHSLTLWHSLGFGILSLGLIRGICYFGELWDRIVALEAAA